MKKTVIILIAAAAAAVACSKAAFEPAPAEGPERLQISGEDNFSKACLTDAYAICWEKDKDKVCVFNKNDEYLYTVTTTGTTAWMEGGAPTMPCTHTMKTLPTRPAPSPPPCRPNSKPSRDSSAA